jgi:energy-converting hydrogenase Eha subunit E
MIDASADHEDSAAANRFSPRGSTGRVLRIVIPTLLWTIVAIAAPTFVNQIRHRDRALQEDFAVYYFSALEMRRGINPYTTNLTDTARASGFDIHAIALSTDPPTFVACFEALTYLPLRTAYLIWQALNLACLVIAVFLLIGAGSGLTPSAALTLGALFLLYPPIASHFWFGQSKFPMLLLFVLMMRSMKRGRDSVAGFALAFATLIHVFPIVLSGYLVLTRRWRTLGWTIAALLIGALATIFFAGWANCLSFVLAIPSISSASWNEIQRDIAAQVFVTRQLRTVFQNADILFVIVRLILIVAIDTLIILATTMATLALPARSDPGWRIFSLWVATAVILLPVAWDYDLVLMLIAFSQLAVCAARDEASRRAIAMAILSYALLLCWEYVSLSANELGFLSMLTAYLSAYWLARDQPDATPPPLLSLPGAIWQRLAPTG